MWVVPNKCPVQQSLKFMSYILQHKTFLCRHESHHNPRPSCNIFCNEKSSFEKAHSTLEGSLPIMLQDKELAPLRGTKLQALQPAFLPKKSFLLGKVLRSLSIIAALLTTKLRKKGKLVSSRIK